MVNNNHNEKSSTKVQAPAVPVLATPASAAGSSSGNAGSTAAGNTGAGSNAGSNQAPASSAGVIPGSASKAKGGPRVEITQIVNGLGSQFPSGSDTLLVKGQDLTVSSLITTLAAVPALFSAVDGAAQQAKSARQALKAALPGARELIAAVRVALVALFGKGNPVLANFGINVSPRKKLTAKQNVARQQKVEATKELRGTIGPRKKQDVKFVGTVQVATATQTVGGNATPTGSSSSSAGATAGAAPSASNAAGNGHSQP